MYETLNTSNSHLPGPIVRHLLQALRAESFGFFHQGMPIFVRHRHPPIDECICLHKIPKCEILWVRLLIHSNIRLWGRGRRTDVSFLVSPFLVGHLSEVIESCIFAHMGLQFELRLSTNPTYV